MSNTYIAIMAGGIGSRFWPKSRAHCPKQFLDILGTGKTLIQSTYERFANLVPEENIFIITGSRYVDLVKEQIPSITDEQIVAEPARRNTAPCVAYIAYKLAAKNPYANFIVAPSDHLILDTQVFGEIIHKALDFAGKNDALVTLGIRPTRPDTGYGYIQYLEGVQPVEGVCKVKTFTEKPTLEIAKTFLESGEFLWNSGIFVWNVQSIIAAFRQFQPTLNDLFLEGKKKQAYNTPEEEEFIKNTYAICTSISIDYAIMEQATNVFVLPASFGWSDLGTWNALWQHHEKDYLGNALTGANVMHHNSIGCMVVAPEKKLVVLQGLENFCVIDTEEVLLICRTDQEQEIKHIHEEVKREKGKHYL